MESTQAKEERRKRFTDIFDNILLNVRSLKNDAPAGSSMLWELHTFEGDVMRMLENHGEK